MMAKSDQRAGWRKSKSRAVTVAPTEFGQRGREGRKLLFRVSMLSTLAIVLMALLIYVLQREPDRDVPLIVSVVSQSGARSNNDALFTAPNPFAQEDYELLRSWFGGEQGDPSENVRLVGSPSESTGVMGHETRMLINAVTKPLATVKPGGPRSDVIAVYLSAHGFVDKGTPYLAVGDSRSDDEQTWIRFQDLLDEVVGTLNARTGDARDVKTVIFIDAARVGPQWDWGQFSESFSDACNRLTRSHADRIAIILSASPGERSWWDPRKGHGLFTQAIVEALTGSGDLDRDGMVTVGEIAQYLQSQVRQSAEAAWDAKQTPMMVGDEAADWKFISQPSDETPPATAIVDVQELRDNFDSVDKLWNRHNQLKTLTHPPLAFNPLGWAALEKKLARLDALLLSGKGYLEEFRAVRSNCESDLTRFENGPNTMPREGALPELALRDYFHGVDHELEMLTDEQSAAIDNAFATWRKKPDIPAVVQAPLSEPIAIRFLWSWLKDKGYDTASLALSADLLDEANLVTGAEPATLLESQLTRLLSAPDLSHLDSETIKILIDCQVQSRDTLCTDDLRASFWIRQRLHGLEQQRLACIDRMLSRNPDEQALGRDRWRRDVSPGFDSLAESASVISRAYKLRDQMMHSIPRISETLMNDLGAFQDQEVIPDSQSHLVIKRAIENLSKLNAALQLPQDDDTRSAQTLQASITDAETKARVAFNVLNERIFDRLEWATDIKASDARGLRQNFALLVGSGTENAELRQRVHTKMCDLIADANAGAGKARNDQLQQDGPTDIAATLKLMSVDGKHVWDHWLASTEGTAAPSPSGSATADVASGDLVKLFQDTGATFRDLVAKLVAGELDERVVAEDVMQDPISKSQQRATLATTRRLIEQWDTFLRARTILFSHAPQKVERIGKGRFALDQQLFLFDHASRTIDEFWCEAREGEQPFFASAADRLLSSRSQNPLFPTIATNLDGINLSERLASAENSADDPNALAPQPGDEYRDGTLLKFVVGKNVDFVLDRPAPIPDGYASMWSKLGDQSRAVLLGDSSKNAISVPMLVPTDIPTDEPSLVADVFFRGLRRSGWIAFKSPTGGIRTVFTLPNYSEPAVRVVREQKEPERFVLVIDCSRSMGAETNAGITRLEVARNAVTEFLDGLTADVEVGLILFGDQYGFKESVINPMSGKPHADGKPKIWAVKVDGEFKYRVEQLVQGRVIDAGHVAGNEQVPFNPNFDVRVGAPIAGLDDRQRRALKKQIFNLGPIGTTPTYRAIVEAYKQLGTRRGHIIVLTDGLPTVVPDSRTVNDMSKEAMDYYRNRKNDVRLTFVRYLISAKQLENEFMGAKFLDAADGQALLRHLRSIRTKPEVFWERDGSEASSRGDFESLVVVSQWPPQGVVATGGQPVQPSQLYTIRATIPDSSQNVDERTEVRVEGGEQFELLLSDGNLTHRPFDYEFTQLQSITTSLVDASRFQVRAGPVNRRENQQLTIQLAIESANGTQGNGKFTPRPADIWVELTGISSRAANRGRNEVYSFSLPEFQVRRSIPILLCRIDDFDKRYDKIEVKAWMRFADKMIPGASIQTGGDEMQTVDGLPGVSFRTQRSTTGGNGIRITVTEQYSDEREPGSVRVLPTPLPNRASTVLFANDRIVTRTFDYDDADTVVALSAVAASEIQKKSSLLAEGTISIDFDSR